MIIMSRNFSMKVKWFKSKKYCSVDEKIRLYRRINKTEYDIEIIIFKDSEKSSLNFDGIFSGPFSMEIFKRVNYLKDHEIVTYKLLGVIPTESEV